MRKQLPDTPWHIGSPKMKESDHRRLNKWCVHYDSSICTEPKSGCYLLRCAGSSHCKFYAEDEKTSEKIERDNRTQAEIESEHRRQYIETLKPKMKALISSFDSRRYTSAQFLRICYICGNKLVELSENRKQCTFCHMEYVNQTNLLSADKTADGRFIYVMGQQKPEETKDLFDEERCEFCDDINRCGNKDSQLFKKRCNPNYCKNVKKRKQRIRILEENAFLGIKNISLKRIIARTKTPPKQSNIDREAESIQRDGRVRKPVYVEIYQDKYLLKSGYVQYFAALQCGLTSIPATMEWEIAKEK